MSNRKRHKQNILVENPHISSYASSILLKRQLYLSDPNGYAKWLEFRLNLLLKWEKERNALFCHYCGKGPLLPHENNKHPFVATIDHKIARSKGGAEYDENNLVVACYNCNQKKADN